MAGGGDSNVYFGGKLVGEDEGGEGRGYGDDEFGFPGHEYGNPETSSVIIGRK